MAQKKSRQSQIELPHIDHLRELYRASAKRKDLAGVNIAEAAVLKAAAAEGSALQATILAKILSEEP